MYFRNYFTYGALFIGLAAGMMGCGKKSDSSPSTTTTTTTTTTTSSDPSQYGTPFASVPATKDIIMYEVNERTFTPANFQGVINRLDSIKALGVNVVWLMPIYPIGSLKSVGSPYCVKDYQSVNTSFGALSDLRTLVDKAHSLGMAVILDWVANDTAWDATWISNPTWYEQDGSGNIISPPNTTYTDVAALNFNNYNMRTAMIKAMKYWIYTANVDGYRCDFADNIPSDFWTQALDTLNNIKTHKLILLAEGTTSAEISSGFQLDYAFSYYSTLKSVFAGTSQPSTLFSTNSAEIASIPSSGTKLRYITNHDDASSDGSTITEYKSKQGALAAFVLAAYMDGVPLIYSSQEVGYGSSINFFNNVAVDYTQNPDMVAAYKKIIAFRSANEALKTGSLTTYTDSNISAFERVSGSDDVLVLVNVKNAGETFSVPTALQGTTWTDAYSGAITTLGTSVSLTAYQYLVLKKN